MFFDYGLAEHLTLSFMLPYIYKQQRADKFGIRTADGIGDSAVFGRYEIIVPRMPATFLGQMIKPGEPLVSGPSLSLGLDLKFPTGSITQPGGKQPNLTPAFQNGSGAYDLVPTLSYF